MNFIFIIFGVRSPPAGSSKDNFAKPQPRPQPHSPYVLLTKCTFLNKFNFFLSSLLLSFLTFTSCNTFSSVSSEREDRIWGGKPAAFASVEAVEPLWLEFADGVDYFHGKITSPKLEFWALRVDLSSPKIRIVVKGGMADNDTGSADLAELRLNAVLSTKVTAFVRDNNLIAGVNALPFDKISSREGRPIQNMGIVISDGKIIAPANTRYDAVVFYRDGGQIKAAIVSQSDIQSAALPAKFPAANIQNAAGGFYQILAGGETTERTRNVDARHPRSAAGVSPNGSRLYLLVIDGRRSGSVGATEGETALLLRSLGSWDGLNFDGGGSSALALRGSDSKIRTVNTPIHARIPGMERAVAGCVGVAADEE